MSIMDGLKTPDDEDDLIVDLEPEQQGIPEAGDDEVEEYTHVDPDMEAPTLPDELEAEAEEPAEPRQGRQKSDDEPSSASNDAYQRAMEAETRARQAEAYSIMTEARANAAIAEQQRNTARVALDTLNVRLDGAYAELARARDNADSSTEIQIQRAINEMTQLKGQIEATQANIADPRALLAQAQQRAQGIINRPIQGKRVGAGIQARHPLAERWAGSNGWMKQNASANNFVIRQSQSMTNDGWDPNSPGFYAELSRRVKQAFPDLKVSALQAQRKGPQRGAVKSPVAPASSSSGIRTGAAVAANKARYTLTNQDQAAMRRMNLDPGNKLHRKYFAKSRIESSRSASRSGN